jgi:hypothetical protein
MKQFEHDHDDDVAQPLGPQIKTAEEEKAPEWYPVPDRPGLERDQEGRLRTNDPQNKVAGTVAGFLSPFRKLQASQFWPYTIAIQVKRGRPSPPESESHTERVEMRLPASLAEKLKRLGGVVWIRERIAREKESKPSGRATD